MRALSHCVIVSTTTSSHVYGHAHSDQASFNAALAEQESMATRSQLHDLACARSIQLKGQDAAAEHLTTSLRIEGSLKQAVAKALWVALGHGWLHFVGPLRVVCQGITLVKPMW